MKLSEAMRAGAKLVPQCYGRMFEYETLTEGLTTREERICGACALGLAFIGARPEAVPEAVSIGVASIEIDHIWPELLDNAPGYSYTVLYDLIVEMNDDEKIPVEEIADRLEALGL